MVVVVVVVVVEIRVVKLVKLISVYLFDIFMTKKLETLNVFKNLSSKYASRPNGVHFFDI